MKKVKVTQIKSDIGASVRQRANLAALGLTGINTSRSHDAKPEIMGMIKKVSHLIVVDEA